MTKKHVLFIQGGGQGAHEEDALLAGALGRMLGAGYDVRFPEMPNEDEPELAPWKEKIASELAGIDGEVILVGHSLGGAMLLRFLCDEKVERPITAAYFLAAPAFDGERWSFDDLKLPADAAQKVASIPRLTFFHCRDDEIVPFAHLALHAAQIPRAITRVFETGGHQLDDHLGAVADDIRARVGP